MWLLRSLSLPALAVLVGSTCEPTSAGGGADVEVTDSAGVTLVRNRYEGFDTLAARLVEETRIGLTGGPDEYQFHRILGLTVDALARTFVANGATSSVRVYDRQGQWVRDIGRRGSGPGEFQGLSSPAIWRDSLGVYDSHNLHFALFDTAGQLLDSWSMVLPDGRVIYPLRGGPAGWTVWLSSIRAPPARAAGTLSQDTIWLGHAALGALADAMRRGAGVESAILGTVPWPSVPRKWAPGERSVVGWPPLFGPERRWSLDDAGRIYLSAGYPYVIDVFDEAGRHVRRITRAFRQRPVTDAHVNEYLSRMAAPAQPDRFTESRLRSARLRAEAYRADFFGVTRALLASRNGEIWVERPDALFDIGNFEGIPGFEPGPRYWDVLDAEGRYEFTVRLPDRFSARWIDRRAVVGVLRDESDVEYVVRYRLETGGGAVPR